MMANTSKRNCFLSKNKQMLDNMLDEPTLDHPRNLEGIMHNIRRLPYKRDYLQKKYLQII
jgi:hypothetical protein